MATKQKYTVDGIKVRAVNDNAARNLAEEVSGTSTKTPTLTDRYSSTPSNTRRTYVGQDGFQYDQSTGEKLGIAAPDESSIREKYRQNAQSTVDAIRSQFQRYVQEDTEAKKKLETKAYLTTLANGTASAPSGAAQITKAVDRGEAKVRQTMQERDVAIQNALEKADLRASEEFEQRRQEYLASEKDAASANAKLADTTRKAAEEEIAAFAAARSYDEFKTQVGDARVQQYMQETGRDEAGLQALFLKNMKDDLVNDAGTKLADGSIAFFRKEYDDNGNVTGVKEVGRIPAVVEGKKIQSSRITDNGVQILYSDGTYKEMGTPTNSGTTTSPGSNKPVTGAPKSFTESDIEQGRNLLKQFGSNGYANPAFYVDAYQAWVGKGGTPNKFKELYPPAEFVNPQEVSLLPTFLRPSEDDIETPTTTSAPATRSTTPGGRQLPS